MQIMHDMQGGWSWKGYHGFFFALQVGWEESRGFACVFVIQDERLFLFLILLDNGMS